MIKKFNQFNESWFHGTPDSRNIETSGFTKNEISVEYVAEPKKLEALYDEMSIARTEDTKLYFKLLDKVSDYKKYYTFDKPLFLTDKKVVAKTYADPKRSFDYQNAVEKVYEVETDCKNIVRINAYGDRFRFISIDKVRDGFINAGISSIVIDELIEKFNFFVKDKNGIKTDTIAAIGSFLKFDCIDVVGVYDSYNGGNITSTIRIVLNLENIQIKE